MAIFYTGHDHDTPGNVDNQRNYTRIQKPVPSPAEAFKSLTPSNSSPNLLNSLMSFSSRKRPTFAWLSRLAYKYSGGGNGGYALYLFPNLKALDARDRKESACNRTLPETHILTLLIRLTPQKQ